MSIFMYVINFSFIEEVKKKKETGKPTHTYTRLFYGANRRASSISRMPFNLASVVAVRSAVHLRTFTCALPNGIAIREHVREKKKNERCAGGGKWRRGGV